MNRREFCNLSMGAVAAGLAGSALASMEEKEANPTAKPARKWELFVVQHSHIDIGFTDRQEVIADYHRQFIRQAVEMALSEKQKSRHPDCRFKYTIEGFWSLEQFLRSASVEEQAQLVKALKSGQIELTAGYFHMTELLDEGPLRATLQPAQRFAQKEGIPLSTLMGCDINGFSWGYCDLLAEAGVKYLSMNINTHHGGVPFGKPLTPFYWESRSGNRILVWNGLAYHRGNVLGLMGYFSPDTDLGIPGLDLPARHRYEEVRDTSFAERKLLPTLAHLEKTGYPFSFLPIMGNAIYTDNGPAGDGYCDILAQWNARFGDHIHIRTATLEEFFHYLEKTVQDIPVCRGDWTDWWSDGVAATPVDTAIFRNAQRNRNLVCLLDPEKQVIPAERIETIDHKLALYAEHTFGYSDTGSPSLLTHQVFLRKTMHAVEADTLAGRALDDLLRRRGQGEFRPDRPMTYTIINPLPHPVKAAASLPLDYWEHNVTASGLRVLDSTGQSLPSQLIPAPRGQAAITLVDLGPNSEVQVRIEPFKTAKPADNNSIEGFENAFYRAQWSSEKGWFSLVEKTTGKELLAPGNPAMGCPVYQIYPKGDRGSAAGFGYRKRTIPKSQTTTGRCIGVRRIQTGPVFDRWEFRFEVPGTTSYILLATCYHQLPQIELAVQVSKTDITDPEGLYVCFPLGVEDGTWYLDKTGGPIRPGIDQLPETCCDYYCLQSGIAMAGKKLGVAWTTLDAPLVHLGKIRLWDYSTHIEPNGPIYSWLTNNKWETNFRLSCGGRFEFRYLIQAGPDLADTTKALSVCRGLAIPPVVVRG